MADDWIKWVKGLMRKREVVALAGKLKLSRREMAAVLMEVWEWADENTLDGHVLGVTKTFIDELVGVPGLGDALAAEDIGWLMVDDAGVAFPNFCRHNGKSAKQRALTAERKRLQRATESTRTASSRSHRDDGVTKS